MSAPKKIHHNLEKAIQWVAENKHDFVFNPDVDFTRNRKLTFAKTMRLILSMEGGSLKKELYDFGRIHKVDATSSAFVQQRSKISSEAFRTTLDVFNRLSQDKVNYKGYRMFAVDGTDVNHYRDPNSECFVTNHSAPYGYNQTHVNAIYDICNKTYLDVFCQPRKKMDERAALIAMLKRNSFIGKNIMIMDRGYESYNLLAHLLHTKNVDFVMRVKHGAGALKGIVNLPMEELDQAICFDICTSQTNEDKRLGRRFIQVGSKRGKVNSPNTITSKWDFPSPYKLNLRVVRFKLETGQYETLLTSLDESEFSIKDLKEAYHLRWGIETSFRDLKYTIGLINLHSKKEDLVRQEIYAAIIMYNYCSRISACSAVKKQNTKYAYKINFTLAIHFCKTFYKSHQKNFDQLISDISKYTEPVRPGRRDRRKIKPKRFIGFIYRVAA